MTTQHPQAGKVKLLLVDDDHDNLLALQAVLDPLGEELLLATSGQDALRLCLDNDFAAILLDVRMPEMDGFETAELIRARRRSRQTPILFLTAYRSDEQLFRGYDLGAVDFLFKPVVPEVLQSKVAVFVELSRSELVLRKQAEALARTEQKFRAVLEAAPDAMLITDCDGIITLANSRTDSMFGYSRDQLVGRNIRLLIPEWRCPDLTVNSGDVALTEIRVSAARKDGSRFPAEFTRSPFQTDASTLITTAVRDATLQVEAEESIRRVNQELELRVAERTAELTRSNEALRQFAWAASHDLQEPIRMVRAYSQWIGKQAWDRLEPEQQDMLRVVQDNAMRMQGLLSGLQQYIYISESGTQPYAPVDCNKAVRTALSNLDGLVSESNAAVEYSALPTVQAIDVVMVQIFQNLIANAIKYRSERTPEIAITAERSDNCWTVSVRDNGIGIAPEYLEYVFGVFKRLQNRQQSGVGIGLAICKSAVERFGGRIWVESVVGTGSTFRFTIPDRRAAV